MTCSHGKVWNYLNESKLKSRANITYENKMCRLWWSMAQKFLFIDNIHYPFTVQFDFASNPTCFWRIDFDVGGREEGFILIHRVNCPCYIHECMHHAHSTVHNTQYTCIIYSSNRNYGVFENSPRKRKTKKKNEIRPVHMNFRESFMLAAICNINSRSNRR